MGVEGSIDLKIWKAFLRGYLYLVAVLINIIVHIYICLKAHSILRPIGVKTVEWKSSFLALINSVKILIKWNDKQKCLSNKT